MSSKCNCEHTRHFTEEQVPAFSDIPRDGHAYGKATAGERRMAYVGEICDDCAERCAGQFLLPVQN